MGSTGKSWKELSGDKNWEGLLEPLNVDLRRYLIHYGERTGACENAFNSKKGSKGYGCSLYPPEDFFSKLCLQNGNPYKYIVTNFFYAQVEANLAFWAIGEESSWMGNFAVSTDEGSASLGRRDILISWRGTATCLEWYKDFQATLVSASEILGEANNPKVHAGFYSIYTSKRADFKYSKTSAREQILNEVRRLVDKYQDEEISITVTGHSLGAALATLTAMDIVANGYNKPSGEQTKAFMVTAFAYASPRVGDHGFKAVYTQLNTNHDLHVLRIRNALDLVPMVPIILFKHVGIELQINTSKSPYLKPYINVTNHHDLEVYLHGVAGLQDSGEFKLVINRDIALINKYTDVLKDEYDVPTVWWCNDRNKNMVQLDDGHWRLDDYVPDPPTA